MSQAHADLVNPPNKQFVVEQAIREISHIATLPEITLKIIETVEDPNATAQDLHHIIATDPALCARVLKVVNSAFYGLPGQIGSVNRAIVLLGLNAVKNIAIAASLAKLFRGGRLSPRFSARDLWLHSIGVASGVKLMSDQLPIELSDEAFLAGLIHDIGIMVEMQSNRDKLVATFDHMQQYESTLLDAEQAVFGADHQQFGKALCEQWKFPRSFAFVTGYHHHPLTLDPECRMLSDLVHIADILAANMKIGLAATVSTTTIDPDVLDDLKITRSTIEKVCEELPEACKVAEQLLH